MNTSADHAMKAQSSVFRLARRMRVGALLWKTRILLRKIVTKWLAWNQVRAATQHAPVIISGAYDTRLVLYPWNRPNISNFLNRAYEMDQIKALSLLIRTGDIVFDVGAHIGMLSVFASRAVGADGVVFAFEPVPETYWMLRETLVLNRCENVIAVPKAITDTRGSVQMNLFDNSHSAWNTMGHPAMEEEGKVFSPEKSSHVSSETLDGFCRDNGVGHINLLKVDVEGFEKHVFLGARGLLTEKKIDFICFEISQDPLRGAGTESREVFEALESYGYFSYEFIEDTSSFAGPVYDSKERWANYYASSADLSKQSPDVQAGRV